MGGMNPGIIKYLGKRRKNSSPPPKKSTLQENFKKKEMGFIFNYPLDLS